jgi:hypothetical protein
VVVAALVLLMGLPVLVVLVAEVMALALVAMVLPEPQTRAVVVGVAIPALAALAAPVLFLSATEWHNFFFKE